MTFLPLRRIYQCTHQLVYNHVVSILIALLLLGLGVELAGSYDLSMKLVESQARQYAALTIKTLNQASELYSETVAEPLKSVSGVTLTPRYHDVAGGVPIPTTFSIELGEQLSDRAAGSIFRLYSDYPFPSRKLTGGPQDSFEQEALKHLREHPSAFFSRKERIGRHLTFRYAEAVRMKHSCVECHNTIPSSPRRDWQVGDVRGVIAITHPLDKTLLIAHNGLNSIHAVLAVTTVLAILGITLMIGRLRLVNLELEKKVAERTLALDHLANSDELTQIANRRFFDRSFEQEWRRATRNTHSLSLLMCDIDYFKQFNDTYGHQAGDDCLRIVAQALKQSTQRAGEVVARYGGEEFAIILPNTGSDGAIQVATMIQEQLSHCSIEHIQSPIKHEVTLSIGIATMVPLVSQHHQRLFEAADQALYQAKAEGRDRYVLWKK